MRAVLQRVTTAAVTVDGDVVGTIGRGLVVLLGVGRSDGEREADWLADKLVTVRIFESAAGKLDASVQDIGGGVMVVSQFTLYGDMRKGRRPSFTEAAVPERAEALYQRVIRRLQERQVSVCSGRFGAHMQVQLINDGPVTLIMESPPGPSGGSG